MYVVEQLIPMGVAAIAATALAAQIAREDALLFVVSAVVGALGMFAYDRWRRDRRKAR